MESDYDDPDMVCAADRLADVLEYLFYLPTETAGAFFAAAAGLFAFAYVMKILVRESRFF